MNMRDFFPQRQNDFLSIFFHKCKLCIIKNWFIDQITLISQKSFFTAIQNDNISNRMLQGCQSSNIW